MTSLNEQSGEAAAPKLRALIVEDDTLVGMGLRAQLEKLGHPVIAQASNAEEATRFFREGKPELVLMDIRLDQTDGIELAGQLLAGTPRADDHRQRLQRPGTDRARRGGGRVWIPGQAGDRRSRWQRRSAWR